MLMGTSESGQRQDGLSPSSQPLCQGGAGGGQRGEAVDFVGVMGVGGGLTPGAWPLGFDIGLTQCRHIEERPLAICGRCSPRCCVIAAIALSGGGRLCY